MSIDAGDRADARARRRAAVRARRRRSRTVVFSLLILILIFAGIDLARGGDGLLLDQHRPAGPAAAGPAPDGTTPDGTTPADTAPVSTAPTREPQPESAPVPEATALPATGSGTFGYATGTGRVSGGKGTLRRYRVAVEKGSGQDPAVFARRVEAILAGPDGWTATGTSRFQRVPESAARDFTIYLATAGTSAKLCADGGLHTEGFHSCRLPGQIILNLARWLTAVPDYGAPPAEYQAYALNHELGHQLGQGHEACPGPGLDAPVMQQQSAGLQGCTAYGWPFRHGLRYSGTPIP